MNLSYLQKPENFALQYISPYAFFCIMHTLSNATQVCPHKLLKRCLYAPKER